MKNRINRLRFIPVLGIVLSLAALLTACEQQNYEPNYNTAPGGGTVSTYKAYTLASTDGSTVSGRVVFYKYNATITLVEMGLYNTVKGTSYTTSVYQGKLAAGSTTALRPLGMISGETGSFSTDKYFTISEAGFYDKLSTYDAHVNVMSGTTLVASGDIGANAAPIAQSN